MGPNTKVKEQQCEEGTTQQLLADLTDDFEEAITAQICLNNQFLAANLETETVKENILIFKSENGTVEDKSKQQSMELDNINDSSSTTNVPKKSSVDEESSSNTNPEDKTNSQPTALLTTASSDQETASYRKVDACPEVTESGVDSTSATIEQDSRRATIIAVEELPPIRTDSTMTASEVEDNIEERLSQLDGTSVVQPNSTSEANEVITSVLQAISAEEPRSATIVPPRTAADDLQQRQLQRTPPPSQPQNQLTPQSSASSVNTMGSSTTHIPKDFMKDSSTGEFEDHDLEEVLKALKGLDSSAAADTICDLNVLFNEVYTTLNYEEINSQHNSSGCGSKMANPLKEIHAEIEKKQQTMQRKIEFMLRRLRKMQSRYMCKHTSEEISGLFEWSARIASKCASHSQEDDITERQQLNTVEQKLHPVTSTQLSSILRKIEMVANVQQLTTTSGSTSSSNIGKRKLTKKTGTLIQDSAVTVGSTEQIVSTVTVVPTYDRNVTEEIGHIAGLLQSEMHEIQTALDSDATESSSGGESADEMVTYNNQIQQSMQITKRAAWRYSRDRAAIASRWSWLLSQIADLEIKIRQQTELHQELIRNKGAAVVEKDRSPNSRSSTGMANCTPFNGYKSTQIVPTPETTKESNADEDSSCCRTRTILAPNFRKRKLFQTANIHTFSKKAARPSTIKCGCQWPLLPCALCTGRTDPTSPRDLPDTMMMADRVALLDPGYHPVLSFPEDVSNSIHFEAICRLPDWQHRVLRCPVKNIAKNVWRAERDALHALGKKNPDGVKRKYVKKKDQLREQQQQQQAGNGNGTGTLSVSSTPLVANKLRNNMLEMSMKTLPSPARNNNNNHNRNNHHPHLQMSDSHHQTTSYAPYSPNQAHSSSISSAMRNSKNRQLSLSATASNSNLNYNHHHHANDYNYSSSELNYLHSDSWDSQVTRSRTSSPTNSGSKKNKSLDRRNRTSYDIDNIVIPYSVAAATRVELLPYKEIPTPKWRVIEEVENLPIMTERLSYSFDDTNMGDIEQDIPVHVASKHPHEAIAGGGTITISEKKPATINNIVVVAGAVVAGLNHCSETSVYNAKDVNVDCISNNKCRLTTKRTYSEKENSVDPHIEIIKTAADSSKTKFENTASKILNMNRSGSIQELELNDNSEFSFSTKDCYSEEDITDEAMMLRHEKALVEERERLKYPWSTRSRANRRIDSRVDWSSGANTPDPASPATNTPSVGGGDFESIPSPAAPSTPLNTLESTADGTENAFMSSAIGNTSIVLPPPSSNNKRNNDRRRVSTVKNMSKEHERRSTSPDSKELLRPYEPRKFPIPHDVFENMIKIDNIVNAISIKSKSTVNCTKNEIISKKRNRKNPAMNSSITSVPCQQGGGTGGSNEYFDDSYVGLYDVGAYDGHHHLYDHNDDLYGAVNYDSRNPLQQLGRSGVGGDSDMDTSEADPFSDDDPNDPEWKGESEEREKTRRKF